MNSNITSINNHITTINTKDTTMTMTTNSIIEQAHTNAMSWICCDILQKGCNKSNMEALFLATETHEDAMIDDLVHATLTVSELSHAELSSKLAYLACGVWAKDEAGWLAWANAAAALWLFDHDHCGFNNVDA